MTAAPQRAPVVGVTGLPCAGKTHAARLLADGAVTGTPGLFLQADGIGHEVLARPDVKERLAERFGAEIFSVPDERAARRKIAEAVFANPADLAWLEALVHPLVDQVVRETIARDGGRMAVVEAALLLEAGMDRMCDLVLVIDAPREIRLARAARRGWDADELDRRDRRLRPLFAPERLAALGSKCIVVPNAGDDDIAGTLREIFARY